MSGYQFDIYDSPTGNIGALYEGQGRGFSANTGEVAYLTADANNNAVKTILGRTSLRGSIGRMKSSARLPATVKRWDEAAASATAIPAAAMSAVHTNGSRAAMGRRRQ